jgi:hypothetical protein
MQGEDICDLHFSTKIVLDSERVINKNNIYLHPSLHPGRLSRKGSECVTYRMSSAITEH